MLKKNLTPINRQIKLSHYVINDKLLFSVSPRAGHFTFLGLVELLQKNGVKCERIKFNQDIKKITSLKNVKKVKFVRNPFHRAVSSYTTFCNNPVFKLWGYFGLNLEQKNDLTFRQFIQLLKTKNIQNIDHHLTNQVENGEGELFSYDRIEKIENYLDFLPDLLKEAEVDIDLKSLEPKHIGKKIDSKEPAMDIPFKDFLNKDENKGKKGLQQPPYECFYDEELKKEVAEIYKTDLYDYNIEPIVKKIDYNYNIKPIIRKINGKNKLLKKLFNFFSKGLKLEFEHKQNFKNERKGKRNVLVFPFFYQYNRDLKNRKLSIITNNSLKIIYLPEIERIMRDKKFNLNSTKKILHKELKNTKIKKILKGTYIFGGDFKSHYGHFLLESIGRIDYMKKNPEIPVVFLSKFKKILRWQKEILDFLKIKNKIILINENTKIENLIIKKPMIFIGCKKKDINLKRLEFFNVFPCKLIKGKKVWLSRSNLEKYTTKCVNEKEIEKKLKSKGWIIYHPEEHSFIEQLKMISTANHVSGFCGSPFHTFLFLKNFKGKIIVFSRLEKMRKHLNPNLELIRIIKNLNQENVILKSIKNLEYSKKNKRVAKLTEVKDIKEITEKLGKLV